MLKALQASYEKVLLRVKVNGRLGPTFASLQGVKQGCPLSPGLFGFFVEVVADYIEAKDRREGAHMCVERCPMINGRRVPLLFYADDLSLFATTLQRLALALRLWTEFCLAFDSDFHPAGSPTYVHSKC